MKKKSTSKNQKRQDTLNMVNQNALTKEILDPPKYPWKHSVDSKQEVLTYKLTFKAEEGQSERIQMLVKSNPFLNTKALMGNFSVAQSPSNLRIECHGESIHGSDFIYITDQHGGFVLLDRPGQAFLHFAHDKTVKTKFGERIKGKIEMVQASPGKIKATIQLTQPLKMRYELLLDTNESWKPFAKQVLWLTLGCPDHFDQAGLNLQEVWEIGIPVEGSVYVEARPGHWQKISAFNLTDPSVQTGLDHLFDIPINYSDLRKHKNDGTKKMDPGLFAPKMRLSEIRKDLHANQPTNHANNANSASSHSLMNDQNAGPNAVARFQSGGFDFPTCFPETYGALLANLIDQKLLDDLKYLINTASRRLTGFSGSDGIIKLDWMNQVKAFSDNLPDGNSGGFYELLHEEGAKDTGDTPKTGLMDILAESVLPRLLSEGNTLTQLGLTAELQQRINTIVASTSIAPTDRYNQLTDTEKGALIDAYVFKSAGTIKLEYPYTSDTRSAFHGLINFKVTDIRFDISIDNNSILEILNFDNEGIHFKMNLPDAGGQAWVLRWPSVRYWAVLAAAGVSCIVFPFTCFLLDKAATVAAFLALDLSYVQLEITEISIDGHIKLVPDTSNVLMPAVDLSIDGYVSGSYVSVLPTVYHQLLMELYTIIIQTTSKVISYMEDSANSTLSDFLTRHLHLSYPPSFGSLPLVGIENQVEFIQNDHGYVEQALNAGLNGVINPYITQLDSNIKPNIISLQADFKSAFQDPVDTWLEVTAGSPSDDIASKLEDWIAADLSNSARYYLGTVLSQNFINEYLYSLWRRSLFNYNCSPNQISSLFLKLFEAFPAFESGEFDYSLQHVHLWPAVPPRFLLTPKPASQGEYYSTCIFDDVRLCFETGSIRKDVPGIIEFSFSAQTFTEIGFGAYDPASGKLNLLRLNDRVFDVYFDFNGLGVQLTGTDTRYFNFSSMQPSVDFDYSVLDNNSLQDMLSLGLSFSLASRDSSLIPRDASDPKYIQRYDLATSAARVVFQLVPFRGNLYISKGFAGIVTAGLEGAVNIDTMDKMTGQMIRGAIFYEYEQGGFNP